MHTNLSGKASAAGACVQEAFLARYSSSFSCKTFTCAAAIPSGTSSVILKGISSSTVLFALSMPTVVIKISFAAVIPASSPFASQYVVQKILAACQTAMSIFSLESITK